MRSIATRNPILGRSALFLAALALCWHIVASAAPRETSANGEARWVERPLGADAWDGPTLTVTEGSRVLFLHGRDVTIYERQGAAQRLRSALPIEITPLTAAVPGPGRTFYLAGGPASDVFRMSTVDWTVERLPALEIQSGKTLRLAIGPEGSLHAASKNIFKKFKDGPWISLANLTLVSQLGKYSAGLYRAPDGLFAFGDHHLGYYEQRTDRWVRLVGILGFRPALGRGGMSTQHPETGQIYLTLGKGSNTLGCTAGTGERRSFRYLLPRLPIGIDDPGETLFFTRREGYDVLNLVSPSQGVWLSIPEAELTRTAGHFGEAEGWQSRAAGELVRERDSIANMVYVPPHVYVQRKNLVRRFHLGTRRYSKNMAGFRYGNLWIGTAAAAVTDGDGQIFLITGNDRKFFALHLRQRADGFPNEEEALLDVEDMLVTEMGSLPENVPGNTALAWMEGRIFALLNADSRKVFEFTPGTNRWSAIADLPRDFPYSAELGTDLLALGGRLLLLSGNRGAWFDLEARRWSTLPPFTFTYSADGGMAIVDVIEQRVYVVIGGGSRDLGIVTLKDGTNILLQDFLPDRVSVHGHRSWIADLADQRYLYIFRGHDSNELWRHRLPLPSVRRAAPSP